MIPIFIGGTGRSGTTALKRALGKHPNVSALPIELRFIVDPGGLLDLSETLTNSWTPQAADTAVQTFQSIVGVGRPKGYANIRRRMAQIFGAERTAYAGDAIRRYVDPTVFDAAFEKFLDGAIDAIQSGHWIGSSPSLGDRKLIDAGPYSIDRMRDMSQRLTDGLFKADNVVAWVDDTPYSFLRAPDILRLYPNAKIIHIYRHPLDVLSSHLGRPWSGNDPIVTARRISNTLQHWDDVRQRLPEASVFEVALESIVEDPQRRLRTILDFVGISSDIDITLPAQEISADAANIGRWRTHLPSNTVAATKAGLAVVAERYGYPLE